MSLLPQVVLVRFIDGCTRVGMWVRTVERGRRANWRVVRLEEPVVAEDPRAVRRGDTYVRIRELRVPLERCFPRTEPVPVPVSAAASKASRTVSRRKRKGAGR